MGRPNRDSCSGVRTARSTGLIWIESGAFFPAPPLAAAALPSPGFIRSRRRSEAKTSATMISSGFSIRNGPRPQSQQAGFLRSEGRGFRMSPPSALRPKDREKKGDPPCAGQPNQA